MNYSCCPCNNCHVILHRMWFMKQWESCHFNLIWCMTLVVQRAIYTNKLNPASWLYISKLCHGYHYIPTTEKACLYTFYKHKLHWLVGTCFFKFTQFTNVVIIFWQEINILTQKEEKKIVIFYNYNSTTVSAVSWSHMPVFPKQDKTDFIFLQTTSSVICINIKLERCSLNFCHNIHVHVLHKQGQ